MNCNIKLENRYNCYLQHKITIKHTYSSPTISAKIKGLKNL